MGAAASKEPTGSRDADPTSGFQPSKKLVGKDQILVDMLGLNDHMGVSYCVTDPSLEDNPIVYASAGFCENSGYSKEEVEGRNCRFLQGPSTDPADISAIRDAIKHATEASVCLLNYRKDGSTFVNQFYIAPLRNADGGSTAYFLGVQVAVPDFGKGQQASNPGWVYGLGLHA
jgi:PAS domain S-box-containing protein